MHNAHVIYVFAASERAVGMFADCFASHQHAPVNMAVQLKLVQLQCLLANIIERNPQLDKWLHLMKWQTAKTLIYSICVGYCLHWSLIKAQTVVLFIKLK